MLCVCVCGDCSVKPEKGFVSPHSTTKLTVMFHPEQLNNDIRCARMACFIEGASTLYLSLSGACVDQPQVCCLLVLNCMNTQRNNFVASAPMPVGGEGCSWYFDFPPRSTDRYVLELCYCHSYKRDPLVTVLELGSAFILELHFSLFSGSLSLSNCLVAPL